MKEKKIEIKSHEPLNTRAGITIPKIPKIIGYPHFKYPIQANQWMIICTIFCHVVFQISIKIVAIFACFPRRPNTSI